MRFVSRLLLLRRTESWILSAQRTGDDRHLGQTMILAGGQHHAPQARIQRQPGQIATQTRQVLPVIRSGNHGAQLLQQ